MPRGNARTMAAHTRGVVAAAALTLTSAAAGGLAATAQEPAEPYQLMPVRIALATRHVEGMPVLLARGLRVGLECPGKCTATSTIQLPRRSARRIGIAAAAVSLGKGTGRIPAGGEMIYIVKVAKTARMPLRKAGRIVLVLQTKVRGATIAIITRRVTVTSRAPANHKPVLPADRRTEVTTSLEFDETGRLSGGTSTITLRDRARDPDGDPLTYSWRSSSGTVISAGRRVLWMRDADAGLLAEGTLTLTVSDGRGGKAPAEFTFAAVAVGRT
jgi:hypothetical protein